ncbi:hypothetical protein OEB99_13045 [Actinotalea sp. M2MS4P-6]|uniref:hypothetical protein n=1 Tax=Actinotalea sp. M2MS4P-6 TaxID=2983762 RepID=UPI0021E3AE8F|nr:hypothetical protein [Actinotalea sp. M2MS4P-6]MCV2395238.1 hypothetical protein [Actinotalea sp. M2MS4P-6]
MRTPETRLFQSSWADGSLDLVAGTAVVMIGVGFWLDLVWTTAVAPPLALTGWYVLHGRVVAPRAGRAVLRRDRRERSRRELGWSVGLGTLVLVLTVVAAVLHPDRASDAVDGLPAVLVALLSGVSAVLTRSSRFAWYAAVLAVAGVLTVLVGAGPGAPLVLGGAVAATTGAILLGRFLADTRETEE